jgi:perosamine synthetase
VAAMYNRALQDISEVTAPAPCEPTTKISWFVYVVRLADDFDRNERDRIVDEMTRRGIGCRNYFPPIHLSALYRNLFRFKRGDFPVTEHISDRTIALPFFNRLSEEQIAIVCKELRQAIHLVKRARTTVCTPDSTAA